MKHSLIFYFLFHSCLLQAQHLDVQGHGKLRGNFDLGHMDDSTSVYVGHQAGWETNHSISRKNTFMGFSAGLRNKLGQKNTFLGANTGLFNSLGTNNTFVGESAGRDNISGINTFVGNAAGILNTSGYQNTFLGAGAGQLNKQGFYNTFVGVNAGLNNTTGTRNTAIGVNANVSSEDLYNATALGFNAEVNMSNKVRIGDVNVSVIEGQVAFSASSDRRLKENIADLSLGLEFICDLDPVLYHRIGNPDCDLEMGLIAQDLLKVINQHQANNLGLVHQVDDGFMSVRYNDLLAPLIKAVQELAFKNLRLEQQMELLQDKFDN